MSLPPVDMESCCKKERCLFGPNAGKVYDTCDQCGNLGNFNPQTCDCDGTGYGMYLVRTTFTVRRASCCFDSWAGGCDRREGASAAGGDTGAVNTRGVMAYNPSSDAINPERNLWLKGESWVNVNGANANSQNNNNSWVLSPPGTVLSLAGNNLNPQAGASQVLDIRVSHIGRNDPDNTYYDPEIGGWALTGTYSAVDMDFDGFNNVALAYNACTDPKMDENDSNCSDGEYYSCRALWNNEMIATSEILDYVMDPLEQYEIRQSQASANPSAMYEISQQIRNCDDSDGRVTWWNSRCDLMTEEQRDALEYAPCYACSGEGFFNP